MGMLQTLDAKDIRWSALQNEFDSGKFRLTVTKDQGPDGTQLRTDMPHWNIGNDDLADLIAYLRSLPQNVDPVRRRLKQAIHKPGAADSRPNRATQPGKAPLWAKHRDRMAAGARTEEKTGGQAD